MAMVKKAVLLCASLSERYTVPLATNFASLSSSGALSRLNFSDHVQAFQQKTTWEVARGLLVLLACSNEKFATNSLEIFNTCQRLLGKRTTHILIGPLFYKHFVAGDNLPDIQCTVNTLKKAGISPLLAVPVEEVSQDKDYESNYLAMMDCLDISAQLDQQMPMMQLKMTALVPKSTLLTLHDAYSSARQEEHIDNVAKLLATGEDNAGRIHKIVGDAQYKRFLASMQNLAGIGRKAAEKGVRVLVDAEYSYINGGLSLLTQAAMLTYNQEKPVIWNTYQCYLKAAKQNIHREANWAERKGIAFGAKIVRGAYIQYENSVAKAHNVPSLVHSSHADTNICYDEVVDYMLERIAQMRHRCNIIVASHNESSIQNAIKRIEELNIKSEERLVLCGQLMGMCDHVSYTLGQAGYPTYKSIPFGSISATLPYLSRRAQENTSIIQGARRERRLLALELKHRVFS